MSDGAIFRTIRDGSPSKAMPSFGDSLDDSKLHALVKYVRALQGEQQPAKSPGNPAEGESLFFGKAGCSECHMVNGAGGFIGPDLSNFGRGRLVGDIRNAIVSPNENSTRKAKVVSLTTGSGENVTGIVRNEDNFSLQLQSTDGAFHLLMKSGLGKIEYRQLSLMPDDYGRRLNAVQINDLISFIISAVGEYKVPTPRSGGSTRPRAISNEN